jgi:outer membrane protein OmpA-like peptidoglycan-associated protein
MMKSGFSFALATGIVLSFAVSMSGCATKDYVRQGFEEQDRKIAELKTTVESNQKWNEEQIAKLAALSDETQQALNRAQDAMSEAEQAHALAKGKLLYAVALSNDKALFGFNSAELSDNTKAILDEFLSLVKSENRNVFIEIHGHTDSTGPDEYNRELGLKRAEMTKSYLFGNGVPLHKLSTISYGESEPVADNDTREGRAKNRRVVILVLE